MQAVERRQEAVARGLDLATAKAFDRCANGGMMAKQPIAPRTVAEGRELFGRTDDVGEDDGRQDPIYDGCLAHSGEELADFIDDAAASGP